MLVPRVGEMNSGPDRHQGIPAAWRELCKIGDPMLAPYMGEIKSGPDMYLPIPAACCMFCKVLDPILVLHMGELIPRQFLQPGASHVKSLTRCWFRVWAKLTAVQTGTSQFLQPGANFGRVLDPMLVP